MDVKVNKVNVYSHFLNASAKFCFIFSMSRVQTVTQMWNRVCMYNISFIVYTQRIYATIHWYLGCDGHINGVSRQLQIFQKNIFRYVQDRKEK